MTVKSKTRLNAWINNELRECTLRYFNTNFCTATFDNDEEIAIWFKDGYWNIEFFIESTMVYSAKIIAYAQELKTEHVLKLIQTTYEMANYGEVNFDYA